MIKSLLNGILKIILKLLGIFLTPIDALIGNIFPDMASAIQTFNNFVNNTLGNNLVFFFHLLPPIFRGLLVIWFTFVVAYYTIYYTYLAIIKVLDIIQKIKFW